MQEGELCSADRVGWVEQQSQSRKSQENFGTSDQAGTCELDRKTACTDGIGELDASVVISCQDAYVSRRYRSLYAASTVDDGMFLRIGEDLADMTGDCLRVRSRCSLFVATNFPKPLFSIFPVDRVLI